MIKQFIKQVVCEALSEDTAYKSKTKSLFENWITKFSASYLNHRKQNYPDALPIKSLSYAEDFNHQHIKLHYKEHDYKDYALIFEYEGSVYIANNQIVVFTFPLPIEHSFMAKQMHKRNYSFKLSLADFESASDVADNYAEFLELCKQMNEEYKEQE